jgi:hypothetical protein
MLKTSILHLEKTLFTTLICLFFASCQFQGIKGSGNSTTENRSVDSNFKSIEAGKGIDVIIEQNNEVLVTVIADDNIQKHIVTKVENGVLIITSDTNNFYNVKSKKVVVKMPIIEGIQVISGASVQSRNIIKSNSLSINSSSGSKIEITIEAEKTFCESSSGSQVIVKGKAIELETSASSGSSIDAKELLSNDVMAEASSGSSITVYPLRSLKAEAASGANIIYYNTPRNLDKKISSGGNIGKE